MSHVTPHTRQLSSSGAWDACIVPCTHIAEPTPHTHECAPTHPGDLSCFVSPESLGLALISLSALGPAVSFESE